MTTSVVFLITLPLLALAVYLSEPVVALFGVALAIGASALGR